MRGNKMTKTDTYDGIVWRQGKRVLLCPIAESDLPHFQQMVNDSAVQRYIIVDWPLSEVGQRTWYERVSKPDPNNITVAIRTLSGELIGNMAIVFNEKKRTAKTGSLIGHGNFRGKGYGTDAKMTMLDYAFNWRGVRKVTSPILGYNARSRRYAKKCGYRYTARIPQEHFRFGKWRSEVIYTCCREEWLALWEQYQNVP